jgi:hypothetical protein
LKPISKAQIADLRRRLFRLPSSRWGLFKRTVTIA